MSALQDRAEELFRSGYNCSQAVYGAFAESRGMNFDEAMLVSSSFGGGIARMREVCGAVSGICLAIGVLHGTATPDKEKKAAQYKLVQELAERFRKKNGSIICRELLGLGEGPDGPHPTERTERFYQKRPCVEYVRYATGLLEEAMKGE